MLDLVGASELGLASPGRKGTPDDGMRTRLVVGLSFGQHQFGTTVMGTLDFAIGTLAQMVGLFGSGQGGLAIRTLPGCTGTGTAMRRVLGATLAIDSLPLTQGEEAANLARLDDPDQDQVDSSQHRDAQATTRARKGKLGIEGLFGTGPADKVTTSRRHGIGINESTSTGIA